MANDVVVLEHVVELMKAFDKVGDPRIKSRCAHKLIDIIVIAILALICGALSVEDIEDFAIEREDWLRRFLELPNGIPSHDTIARVLTIVNQSQVEKIFAEWVQGVAEKLSIDSQTISLDGKSVKGTEREFNGKHRPLHLVTAYSHELGLVLAQASSKSSGLAETKAALECLGALDIIGKTILVDAGLGTKKLAQTVTRSGGFFITPIKQNHKKTCDALVEAFAAHPSLKGVTTVDNDHGRQEERAAVVLPATELPPAILEGWSGVCCLVKITRVRTTKDKRFVNQTRQEDGTITYELNTTEYQTSREDSYYLSSRELTPELALKLIRQHWGIENNLHWVLDTAFLEDDWLVTTKRLAQSLSLLPFVRTPDC